LAEAEKKEGGESRIGVRKGIYTGTACVYEQEECGA
jgi:hypothetical protein